MPLPLQRRSVASLTRDTAGASAEQLAAQEALPSLYVKRKPSAQLFIAADD